jgi:hypothetical protein
MIFKYKKARQIADGLFLFNINKAYLLEITQASILYLCRRPSMS